MHTMKKLMGGLAFLSALYSLPAPAQVQNVDGMTIRIGLVSAEQARQSVGEIQTHGSIPRSKTMKHLVVSLSDANTGERIENAQVTVEVKNPLGQVQKKNMLHAAPAGPSDYSEFFRFDMSGKYEITVHVKRKGTEEPVKASFTEDVS